MSESQDKFVNKNTKKIMELIESMETSVKVIVSAIEYLKSRTGVLSRSPGKANTIIAALDVVDRKLKIAAVKLGYLEHNQSANEGQSGRKKKRVKR